MIKIKKLIKLCKCEFIFPTNEHMLLFTSKENRNNYFESKVVKEYELTIHYDDVINEISFPGNISDFDECNYLFFDNKFFFIEDKVLVNDMITKLIIKLDVLQTYIYDCTFYPSFVDRCHVPRFQSNGFPTNEIVSEGLSIGDYVQKGREEICDLTSSCILATTTPLGYMEKNTDFNPVE